MGIRLLTIICHAKQILRPNSLRNHQSSSSSSPAAKTANVPKGHLPVYIGETYKQRFVVPISYLRHPSFQDLLRRAEEEFGFDHPMGGLTIPCSQDAFLSTISHLND